MTVTTLTSQLENYSIRYLGFQDGLSDRSITSICHDHKGIVWIGTKTGLFRYDGYQIEPFRLNSNEGSSRLEGLAINTVLEDGAHNLWVHTALNTLIISPNLQAYFFVERIESLVITPAKEVYASINGVVNQLSAKWENGQGRLQKVPTPLRGKLIFTSPDKPGVFSYDYPTGTVSVFYDGKISTAPFSLPPAHTFDYINYRGGMLNLSPSYQVYSLRHDNYFRPNTPSYDINNPFGLQGILNDFIRRNASTLPAEIAGAISFPRCVEEDSYGHLWVGTDFGLFMIIRHDNKFQHFDALKGVSVRALFLDRGTLLVSSASTHTLKRIDLKTSQIINEVPQQGTSRVLVPLNADTLMLAGDYDGLFLLDRKSLKTVYASKNKDFKHIYSGARLNNGQIWLGGTASTVVWLLNPKDIDQPNLILKKRGRVGVMAIVASTGNRLWVGQNYGSLHCIDHSQMSENLLPQGMTNMHITCLLERGDMLWIGTRGLGLLGFNIKTQQITHAFKTENGLPNNTLNCMLEDNDGYIWISTNRGLSRFAPDQGVFVNYSKRDGLQIEEFNAASSAKDPETGMLYFGGLNGVTFFDPSCIEKRFDVPNIIISKILRPGLKEGKSEAVYPENEAIVALRANARFIEFHLASSEYFTPAQNTFWYKLEGFDQAWISNGNNPVVQYSSLPAGKYVFHAKVANAEGFTSSEIRIHLHVRQLFYKTWWFISLIAVSLIALAVVYYLNKIGQMNQIIRVKNQIADDLHDDVAASLSQISMLTKSLQEEKPQNATLEQIGMLSDESIGKLGDIIWSIDDKPQTLEALANRLQDHAEAALRPLSHLRLAMHIHIKQLRGNIPAPARHHIMMIFKEAINNIARHTDSEEVAIHLENRHKELLLIITNSFNSTQTNTYSGGKGLKSMARRAKQLNGTLKIKKKKHAFKLALEIPDIFKTTSL